MSLPLLPLSLLPNLPKRNPRQKRRCVESFIFALWPLTVIYRRRRSSSPRLLLLRLVVACPLVSVTCSSPSPSLKPPLPLRSMRHPPSSKSLLPLLLSMRPPTLPLLRLPLRPHLWSLSPLSRLLLSPSQLKRLPRSLSSLDAFYDLLFMPCHALHTLSHVIRPVLLFLCLIRCPSFHRILYYSSFTILS